MIGGDGWRKRSISAAVAIGLLAGCAGPTTTYRIRQRAFYYDPGRLATDYDKEYEYIRTRRDQLGKVDQTTAELKDDCYYDYACTWCDGNGPWMKILQGDEAPKTCKKASDVECAWCEEETLSLRARGAWDAAHPQLTGVALSGGGIRSASFSLGVLQGLDALHAMPRIDYMSAVSGGSYTAGWVQAHLGANQYGAYRDDLYYEVAGVDFHNLLSNTDDNVEQLRTHTQFINGGGFWSGPELIWEYLWRWPISLTWDVLLHIKGNYNEIHPITVYQNRIERTYFRGNPPANASAPPKREAPLTEANRGEFPTPYLIINGNLVNNGYPRGNQTTAQDSFNFELTRDEVGSDGLGYIESAAFDRDVESVTIEHGIPTEVTVKGTDLDTSQFRISQAVATSGAAFDPDGAITAVDNKWARIPAAYAASYFNLNFGYETWNYARAYNGPFWTPLDYVRMQTYQRIVEPETDARWIKVSDGGHYENLGVAALARRGVSCIITVDATGDVEWHFDDLKNLRRRLQLFGLTLELDPTLLDTARRTGHARLLIKRGNTAEVVSTLLYIKPNADPVENGDSHALNCRTPNHMATTWCGADGVPHDKLPSTIDAIRKIKWYQDTKKDSTFPHTTTFIQWYDWETFEAYRLLGFQMARTYLPHGADLTKCEFNDVSGP